MRDSHRLLEAYPVVTTVKLLWGDEDSFGHVNNVAYLRWCETARVEYLIRIALWTEMPPKATGPILASLTCDYKAQLNYPDTVLIGTRVVSMGNSSFRMEHLLVSRKLDAVAAVAASIMVAFDYNSQKPVRVPPDLRKTISDLEGKSFELC